MFSQRTTTMLLDGLRNPANALAWEEFDGRCRPIMSAVARRLGLSDAEAEDAVQAAMLSFLESYRAGAYARERGRLSSFIIFILRARAIDILRRKGRATEGSPAELDQLSEAQVTRDWNDARQAHILRLALLELASGGTNPRDLEAFELYGLRGLDIASVTERLSMSREEVYNAKYRTTRRLQPIVARIDELYEDL